MKTMKMMKTTKQDSKSNKHHQRTTTTQDYHQKNTAPNPQIKGFQSFYAAPNGIIG